MKLRDKVLVVLVCVWVGFVFLTYLGSRLFIEKSFLKLEYNRANEDLHRVMQALSQNNYSLMTFTSDWSHWNDAYDYAAGKNPSFVSNNLVSTAFSISTINVLTYWDKNGKLLVGGAYDLEKQTFMPFPKGIEKYVHPGSRLLDLNKELNGYLLFDDAIGMVASASLKDSNDEKPPLGSSVFIRLLTPQILHKIEDTTKLQIQLFLPNQIMTDKNLKNYFELVSVTDIYNHPIDDENLEGYLVIRDIEKKPIGMVRMITPRSIYLTGKEAIRYYVSSMVILGIGILLLVIFLLRKLILQRLEKLNKKVEMIGATNSLTERVEVSGGDELSSVATQINKMLNIIQLSQEKLERSVEERTQELKTTNIKLEQEIVERKAIEKELIVHKEYLGQLAHYDSLTNLPNRVFFNEMFNQMIIDTKQDKKTFAVLFVDLDRFKTINDALGHYTGDIVLKEVAERFKMLLRPDDILARLGGDEFIILLKDVDRDATSEFAMQIINSLAKPVIVSSHELYIGTSIGVCLFPEDGSSLEELQKNADMAMYKAKHQGGGIYSYFNKDMMTEAHKFIELESALRQAFKNNEFQVYYQPKLDTQTGDLVGAEALIRWIHPEHGIINPAVFIPQAEKTGLIMHLGEWMLREVCKQIKSWQERGYKPIRIAVNLSTKQFQQQDMAKIIDTILNETQLEAKYLEVEITESAMMEDVNKVTHKLENIHMLGVPIAIDDFGSGYTSISFLKQFPIAVLKIDQAFIKGIPSNQNDCSITKSIIDLAHNLGMKVVAEGVETQEQLQWLADFECDIVQGYFLSRPVPESKFISMLKEPAISD